MAIIHPWYIVPFDVSINSQARYLIDEATHDGYTGWQLFPESKLNPTQIEILRSSIFISKDNTTDLEKENRRLNRIVAQIRDIVNT